MKFRLRIPSFVILSLLALNAWAAMTPSSNQTHEKNPAPQTTQIPTTQPDTLSTLDLPASPSPLSLQPVAPPASAPQALLFSQYLPDLLKNMNPAIDFSDKYNRPPSLFPLSLLGFRTSIRAGDSLEYDVPGTYTHNGNIYFLNIGASKPLNNRLALGVDAYVVAQSPANPNAYPSPVVGAPSESNSLFKIGTYDLATYGFGPSATYSREIWKRDVDFRLKLFHEVNGDGTNGSGVFLSASFNF